MERPHLVCARRKACDAETSHGVGDQVFLDAFDDNFGTRQDSPVQAIDDDTRDFCLAGFFGRGGGCRWLLLRSEPLTERDEREASEQCDRADWPDHYQWPRGFVARLASSALSFL